MSADSSQENPIQVVAQQMLDENARFIKAIIRCQNEGDALKCSRYKALFYRNLVVLANLGRSCKRTIPPEKYPA
ncbi:hypothetical protein MRX96_025261 [Rhipicephalus microplus]|uniref:uncharacterized protein LOC119187233 n=1 Tax=Rhipicephalus microplus TaxID=6941 RepID=UPI003F6AFFD6